MHLLRKILSLFWGCLAEFAKITHFLCCLFCITYVSKECDGSKLYNRNPHVFLFEKPFLLCFIYFFFLTYTYVTFKVLKSGPKKYTIQWQYPGRYTVFIISCKKFLSFAFNPLFIASLSIIRTFNVYFSFFFENFFILQALFFSPVMCNSAPHDRILSQFTKIYVYVFSWP